MSAAASLAKSGKLILVISIVVFIAALVVLLMTAGLGNATQAPEARLPVAVSTGTIKIQSGFETPINVFGLVESPKAASLSFDVAGQVTTLLVEEGDVVSQGDILARQDLQRLNARKRELQASLERANADLALTQVNSDRTTSLVERKLESAQRLDEVKASLNVAKAQVSEIKATLNSLNVEMRKATLISPFDGVVNRRFLDEGSVVNAGSPVFGLTSIENYQARFAVPADVIDQFEVNEPVLVKVGDINVAGTVTQRLPIRNVQTRTVDILVTLNSNERVRPGDMAILSGFRSHTETGAWLPVNALSNGLRGLWRVFVLSNEKNTTLEARIVEVVYTDGNNAFVRGALKDGEIYVNEGTHKLAPGQMVSIPSQHKAGAR
ncbi:efflux RND transporter periplasmic adaptor subunit [Alteromonas mediterranea]|jgi:RND family efflux transporter MFP subunit|uniref:Efflux transporter periplasmic adaptor subunit n=2 Tax=Alteromonas mediterranea TaxID=314275 RepID=A0AAC8XGZ1_9ALTE|nr:efflux RND transporter periplasmic adaptor subunit [Alteromonas mediterranea]MBR9898002.1 efflux RND transporter periplasmic adaptor subunit [Gammaproteobacteria bacterium]AEA96641.1 RND transporter [Alteromonas mediterranea DE]AFV83969.1 RND family efflux transporter MFP subunit [Alteromonas mediterranea DE1]AGP95985.1 RND family efflux transporter MFP subunit [Alteromonas mediterranea UM7]AGQ00319.1 RND family efflux transporter MFP subunit [Alteromonas mediterranea UM4b]|tara:strand:- start:10453 stop:11592 length:1140 start_codon:yes stop_codon:yes gene_type:complete